MVTNECAEARKTSSTPWAHPLSDKRPDSPVGCYDTRLTKKIVQWWYTCRNDSCLHDFFRTINTVSMKSSICFVGDGMDDYSRE